MSIFWSLPNNRLLCYPAEFRDPDFGFQISFLLKAQADFLQVLVDFFPVVHVLAQNMGEQ